jgi:excisionase family DNA binding protein
VKGFTSEVPVNPGKARPRGFEPLAFGFVARSNPITETIRGMPDYATSGNYEGAVGSNVQGDAGTTKFLATPLLHTKAAKAPMAFSNAEALLCIRQVADLLGVCRATVYRMVWRGELPCVRIGSAIRIAPGDLDALIAPRRGR